MAIHHGNVLHLDVDENLFIVLSALHYAPETLNMWGQHEVVMLQFACHSVFTWNQILVNSNSQKMSFLALLQLLNCRFSNFQPFLKSQICQNSKLRFSEIVKMAIFEILILHKNVFTENWVANICILVLWTLASQFESFWSKVQKWPSFENNDIASAMTRRNIQSQR